MAVKSKYRLPNPATGEQEVYHFENEIDQMVDMVAFARTIAKAGTSAEKVREIIGAEAVISNTAAAHNSIYRGKDLTDYYNSGQMSRDIQAGNFANIYIGDFVIRSVTVNGTAYNNVKWLVGAIDPHIHCGDTETTAHHILFIPASTLQRNVSMNPTDTTEGGYLGSEMWKTIMPLWAAGIKAAFGEAHVLKHRELLTNAVNTTAPSGAGAGWTGSTTDWAWTDVEVNIPNEPMIYGGRVFSSSAHDIGDWPRQLPLYALKCSHLDDRSWFWLRAVVSSSRFAIANYYGNATNIAASIAYGYGGVRPYFLYR